MATQVALAPARHALATFVRAVLVLRFRFFLAHRHRQTVLEWLAGHPLLVLPDVFNPALFFSTGLLLRQLQALPPRPAGRALDLGTGSGVLAIALADRFRRIVATDVNPEAIRCAEINLRLNRCRDRVELRLGDLFVAVAGERFDLVVFNPPFFPGEPSDWLDRAFFGSDLVDRFAGELAKHLAPGGRALVVFSTAGDLAGLLDAVARSQLAASVVATRRLLCETLYVLEIRTP